MLNMKDFNTELEIRLDWSEMDLFGHINNVSYFKYIQASRVNYWDIIGLTELHKNSNIGPNLASTSCQFKKPLFYPGQIKIYAKVEWMKNSSFQISHKIIDDNGEIVAEAQDIVVLFDYSTNNKINIPAGIKRNIEKREGKAFNLKSEI